jgi:hypothetical protein
MLITSGLVSLNGTQISALPDFTSYSSQIAKITPASTYASNYLVTNTVITSCPTGAAFSASPTLPPVVNQEVCGCMVSSLRCIAKLGLDSGTAKSLTESICGPATEKCPALHGDGSNGTYGAYSMCTSTERLSWALNVLYQGDALGCQNDENAALQNSSLSLECSIIVNQAGTSGTGTITSYSSSTSSTGIVIITPPTATNHADARVSLSHGAIAGITAASIVAFAALLLGSVWFCCMRRRGFGRQKSAITNDSLPDSRNSDSLDQPSGLRGGITSIISNGSREMSDLPPFDGSYMGSWSRSEFQNSSSEIPRHESVDERDTAVSPMHSPVSQHSDLEIVEVIPPSPMDSVKELPAFRTHPEDKSLPSMKLLSPVIKVSPV